MNSTRNLVAFVLVALFLLVGNVIAQTPIGQKPTPKKTPANGPKKLQSPTDEIRAEEVKIRAENPIWSPDGKKIAFVRVNDNIWAGDPNHRQLYIIEENSDKPEAIASISSLQKNFCWSPDSKKIAFVISGQEDRNIYIIDLATGTRTKITNHEHEDAGARKSAYCQLSWSPDGKKIAFTFTAPAGYDTTSFQIWIADAQGKFWFKLVGGINPTWFPDSKRIAFASGRPNQCLFSIININGKNLKEIKNPGGVLGYLRDIYISPDSKFILCGNGTFLAIIELNENPPTLTTIYGGHSDRLPYILGLTNQTMATIRDDNIQVIDIKKLTPVGNKYNVKPPTGAITSQFKAPNLLNEDTKEFLWSWGIYLYRPIWAWSPDNKEIAFVGKNNEIWKMNANGTNQKQLTFERTRLVQLAQQEQEKEQASVREKLESELNK